MSLLIVRFNGDQVFSKWIQNAFLSIIPKTLKFEIIKVFCSYVNRMANWIWKTKIYIPHVQTLIGIGKFGFEFSEKNNIIICDKLFEHPVYNIIDYF